MNRPKMEFVPKTLADLHIEGIHDLNHGRRYGSAQSLSRARLPPTSSLGDIPTSDPLRAWEEPRAPRAPSAPRIALAPAAPRFKPHPAPRSAQIQNGRDPWAGDFLFICFFIFDYVSFDSFGWYCIKGRTVAVLYCFVFWIFVMLNFSKGTTSFHFLTVS